MILYDTVTILSSEVSYDDALRQNKRPQCHQEVAVSISESESLSSRIGNWIGTNAPMNCPICNKEFRRKDNLRVHMRNKHNIGDPTVCKHCGMSFRSYLRLNEHVKLCEMNRGSLMPRFIQNH